MPKLAEAKRISWTNLLFAVGSLIGVWLIIGLLANAGDAFAATKGADWGWIALAFAFAQLPENTRYVRGMIHWLGFRQIGIPYIRRGRIGGMDTRGASTIIRAKVPMSEMLTYEQHLTSATGGRGSYHMEFDHYEEVPQHLHAKIIAASKAERGAEAPEEV